MSKQIQPLTVDAAAMSSGTEPEGALEEQIKEWLIRYLADVFGMTLDAVDTSMVFERYGMDSSAMVGLSGDLGHWLGCAVEPTIAYDHPSIDALAKALSINAKVLAGVRAKRGAAH